MCLFDCMRTWYNKCDDKLLLNQFLKKSIKVICFFKIVKKGFNYLLMNTILLSSLFFSEIRSS